MPFVNNQDIKIHYRVEGSGPALLMLHGIPGNLQEMDQYGYVAALRDDFKLIMIDQRGFGESDKPHDIAQYSLKLYVSDIVAVLDDLGIVKCHVFGFSFGGWITYGLAEYAPERLVSMIIVDGVPGPDDGTSMLDFMADFDVNVAALPADQQARWQHLDAEALLAISQWLERDIPKMIELVDDVIEKIDNPCLVLMSGLPEESEEFKLLTKTAKLVPGAKSALFKDLSHRELFMESASTLPKIKQFLA